MESLFAPEKTTLFEAHMARCMPTSVLCVRASYDASWEALSVSAGVLFPNAVLAVARHEVKAALLTGPVCGCGCGEVCGCWLLVRQSASRCLSAVLPEMQAAVLRAALLAFLLRWGQSVD